MAYFDIDEEKLQSFYKRAWVEAHHGFVDPHKFPYLEKALVQFSRENKCTFTEAFILAKTGKKTGSLF